VFAADAVARMSGTVGVAAVTAGPGMYFYICLHSGMRSEVCRQLFCSNSALSKLPKYFRDDSTCFEIGFLVQNLEF